MSKPRYQTRVPQDMADRIEEMRHDDDGNELMTKSEATKRLLTDGLNADRPLMTLNQVLLVVFMSVGLNAILNGQPGIVLISVGLAGGMALLDGAWVVASKRYGFAGPHETYLRAQRTISSATGGDS